MQPHEIESEYERNTGHVIVRRFAGMDPVSKPGVLVAGHAPFAWGRTPTEAAHNAVVLEEIACLAYHALTINPAATPLSDCLRDKHFLRKRGLKKYYGQE
jgi:L-ribulose-5-phosphate 4-epimerase